MNVAGIDYSTRAVDVVLIPYEGSGAPSWHRFPLTGPDAFDRTRSVADVMPGRHSVYWDDVLAVGIEEPAGRNPGFLFRVQGAILVGIPARMLVEKWMPAQWRKAAGLKGNASKEDVFTHGIRIVNSYPESREDWGWAVPTDATDALCIALATRQAITREQAA